MFEIERKFLVCNDAYKALAVRQYVVKQGYIPSTQTVRVRLRDEEGFLTIKGRTLQGGMRRLEVEKALSKAEAEALLTLCATPLVEKTRWIVPCGKHLVEVDEFHGENEGLVLAEIELAHEEEAYERPSFLGQEVTGMPQYYNSYLVQHPFSQWKGGSEGAREHDETAGRHRR